MTTEEPSPEQPVVREETANRPDRKEPPPSPEPDQDAVEEGEDRLDQAGGGH